MDRLKSWARKMVMLALVSVLLLGLAYSFPADLALLMAIDLSVYVEAVATLFVVAQVAKVRPMLLATRLWLSTAAGRVLGRTSSHAPPPTRPDKPAADNDDEDGPVVFAFAA